MARRAARYLDALEFEWEVERSSLSFAGFPRLMTGARPFAGAWRQRA
jgi:hypothetical protein